MADFWLSNPYRCYRYRVDLIGFALEQILPNRERPRRSP